MNYNELVNEIKNLRKYNFYLTFEICERASIDLLDLLIKTDLYDEYTLKLCTKIYWNRDSKNKQAALSKIYCYYNETNIKPAKRD
jgi:predicted nuclease of restriction endonuclease-like (RecB) superfamily